MGCSDIGGELVRKALGTFNAPPNARQPADRSGSPKRCTRRHEHSWEEK